MTRLGYGDTNKEDRGKKALIKRLAAERAAGEETEQTETTRFDGSLNQAMENLNELQQEKEPNG